MMLPLILVCSLSLASLQRPSDVVKWSAAELRAAATTASGTVNVQLTAKIQSGWKLYALTQPQGGPKPLAIEVADGAPFTVSKKQIVAPKAKTLKDANFGLETLYYEGEAVFTVPVSIAGSLTGTPVVPLEITYQACGNDICLRPFTEKLNVRMPDR
jgi:DsbC/DsbD-like thiol-disulfide interchange protein